MLMERPAGVNLTRMRLLNRVARVGEAGSTVGMTVQPPRDQVGRGVALLGRCLRRFPFRPQVFA